MPRAAVAYMFKHIQLTNDVCGHTQPKMKHYIVQVGVIQFSNDVHVQIPLETQDKDSFEKAMADIIRSHMQSSPPYGCMSPAMA